MLTNILFIFEVEKTEIQIFKKFKEHLGISNETITSVFCKNIYQLFEEIKKDDFLDIFMLLKDNPKNENLKNYDRSMFSQIFLFFDYDGHDNYANDNNLIKMLEFFNEETNNGKLYINYPMVESLKHINDFKTFKDLKVECKINIKYKNLVHNNCLEELKDFTKYTIEIWKELYIAHLSKMNYIVNDEYIFPEKIISQKKIFEKQRDKFINIESKIGVLNSFPIFIFEYYGKKMDRFFLK